MERVAVIFGLKKIGAVDWYQWGADRVIPMQNQDGSWRGSWQAVPDTCFVLLFLNRSNVAPDLTAIVGSGTSSLVSGHDVEAIKRRVRETTQQHNSGTLLEQLAAADDPTRQKAIIRQMRDADGAVYTQSLVAAIAQLPEDMKPEARKALAQRFLRMTPSMLRTKLKADDVETQVAAIQVVAYKKSTAFVPDLIELLMVRETRVRQLSQKALQAITGQDFGPEAGASAAEEYVARKRWKEWWAEQGDR
jgi:hypothetical protein